MSSTASFCHYYNQNECKSCKWIEIPYTKQVEQKEDLLRQALSFLSDFTLEKTVVSKTLGFRNKAKMVVTGSVENPVIGLAGDETLDQGKEILACPIQHPKLNELIQALPKYIHEFNLIPYQIKSREGELKGLILFYSENSNQLYLRFVLRSKECVSRIQKLLPRLQGEFPNLVCVSANIQPVPHAILEGKEEIFVTSRKEIDLDLGRVKLKLSPRAFVQTHTELAKELYGTATSWIAETKPKLMVELFCGQGAFSFFAAGVAEKIIGVELNADAVTTANATAKELGLHHVNFICADARTLDGVKDADLILVNPPRKGLGAEGVSLILAQKPATLIYSSCSVESLASDLQALSSYYALEKIQIFDLFPHTAHFETLVFLKSSISSKK